MLPLDKKKHFLFGKCFFLCLCPQAGRHRTVPCIVEPSPVLLENQAEDFAMACKIRALINEVESKADDDSEILEWITWAKAKADWYDPTVAAKDEFFGERKHEESQECKKLEKRYYW